MKRSTINVAVLVAIVIVAAALAPRAPIVSGALVLVVTALLFGYWYFQRDYERLDAAAMRADVAALRALAEKGATRYQSLVALAVFEGPSSIENELVCECGMSHCAATPLNDEIALVRSALNAVHAGAWKRGYDSLKSAPALPETSRLARTVALRAKRVRVALSALIVLDSGKAKQASQIETLRAVARGELKFLSSPIELAAVRATMAMGDRAGARQMLARLPPWMKGSRLAEARERLAKDLTE